MNAVRNIVETVGSFVPSVGSEPDRETDLFECRNCGRDADADADQCPNSSSPDLRPVDRP